MNELADITTCVHCGQKFSHPRVAIIGDNKARLNSYMKGLNDHLAAKHPELGLQMAQYGMAFMEMLFLRNFKTTDPELSEQQDRVRWQVHQQTLKVRYPDENLKDQAEHLAAHLLEETLLYVVHEDIHKNKTIEGMHPMHAVYAELIAEAFHSIRDALEEPQKYPLPTLVSTPAGAR